MPKQGMGKTGSAPVKRAGQTASGRYGDDPNLNPHPTPKARDLNLK